MEMIQFLEADKEQLMSGLAAAGTPEKAQSVLEKEFDRLLLHYNEECMEEKVRDTARYLLQAAKMMVPMLSAADDVKIWAKSSSGPESEGKFELSVPAIACLAAGAVFLIGSVVGPAAAAGSGFSMPAFLGGLPASILGGVLLFFAGRLSRNRKVQAGAGEQQTEVKVNAEKVYSCMRALVLSIDKSLGELSDAVSYEKRQLPPSSGNGLPSEEADLFSNILEAAYSRREEDPDDNTAREIISAVRYYLHRRQVETVELGSGKKEWFELLPGKQEVTLRPALVRDGTLIRKGLAVTAL
ncbi:MAG: hypothetical protein IJ198_10320 [Lachnospiraceae bacterium]|nr:hypothetical protein [Lachnospiraceae bacterium]